MSKQNKNNPFGVPLGYFDQLEDDLMKNIQATDQKLGPFGIPKNYFNELEHTIYKNTIGLPNKNKGVSLSYYLLPFAAAILLLFVLNPVFETPPPSDVITTYVEEIYSYEIDAYETVSTMELESIEFISNDLLEQVVNADNYDFYLDPYETDNLNTNNYENYDD